MKRRLGIVALLVLMTVPAMAQEEKSSDLTLAQIQAERKGIVEAVVGPSPQQAEDFWQTYWEYRGHVGKVNDKLGELIDEFAEGFAVLNDDRASSMVNDVLEIQDKRAELKQEYAKKFSKILTPKQAVRWYQIENKMDAVIAMELAVEIPFIR